MKTYLDFIQINEKFYKSKDDFKNRIRKVLRTYGAIPINKDDAADVIQRIVASEIKYSKNPDFPSKYVKPVLGDDIDLNLMKISNKVRFYDYLNRLMKTKTIRGDSFEGLIAGLYDGELSDSKSSKYDVILPEYNMYLSVKFLDSIKERPVLGNIKSDINKYINNDNQPLNVFLNKIGTDASSDLLNMAFSSVTHFLFAYPSNEKTLDLECLLVTRESLIQRYIYNSEMRYAPKQKDSYQIRINITELLKTPDVNDQRWLILEPIITEEDFKYVNIQDQDVSTKLFGTDKDRIRGSVLNSIIKFGNFENRGDKEVFVFDFEKYKKERGY